MFVEDQIRKNLKEVENKDKKMPKDFAEAINDAVDWQQAIEKTVEEAQNRVNNNQTLFGGHQNRIDSLRELKVELDQKIAEWRGEYKKAIQQEVKIQLAESLQEEGGLGSLLSAVGDFFGNVLKAEGDSGYVHEWTTKPWGIEFREKLPGMVPPLNQQEDILLREEFLREALEAQRPQKAAEGDQEVLMENAETTLKITRDLIESLKASYKAISEQLRLLEASNLERPIEIEKATLKNSQKVFEEQIRDHEREEHSLRTKLKIWEIQKPLYSLELQLAKAQEGNEKEKLEEARLTLLNNLFEKAKEIADRSKKGEQPMFSALADAQVFAIPLANTDDSVDNNQQISVEEEFQSIDEITFYQELLSQPEATVRQQIVSGKSAYEEKNLEIRQVLIQDKTIAGYDRALGMIVAEQKRLSDVVGRARQTLSGMKIPLGLEERIQGLEKLAEGLDKAITGHQEEHNKLLRESLRNKIVNEELEQGGFVGALAGMAKGVMGLFAGGGQRSYAYTWSTTPWGRAVNDQTAGELNKGETLLLREEVMREVIGSKLGQLSVNPNDDMPTQMAVKKEQLQEKQRLHNSLSTSDDQMTKKIGSLRAASAPEETVSEAEKSQAGLREDRIKIVGEMSALEKELRQWELDEPIYAISERTKHGDNLGKAQAELELAQKLKELIRASKDSLKVAEDESARANLKEAIQYYSTLRDDPARKLRVLQSDVFVVGHNLDSLNGKIANKDRAEALRILGAGIIAARNDLDRLSVELLFFSDISEEEKQTLESNLQASQVVIEDLKKTQGEWEKDYKNSYRVDRKKEIEKEMTGVEGTIAGAVDIVKNYISNFLNDGANEMPIFIHDWQNKPEDGVNLSYTELQIVDAEIRKKVLDERIQQQKLLVQGAQSADENKPLQAALDQFEAARTSAFYQARELSTSKLANEGDQITKLTGLKRREQKRIRSDIEEREKFLAEHPNLGDKEVAKERRRIGKLEKEFQTIEASLRRLKASYGKTLELYQKCPEPPRTMFDCLAKTAWDAVKHVASLGYLTTGLITPQEMQTRWELALQGYDWKEALKGFASLKGANKLEAAGNLVKEFLLFADEHPTHAASIFADVAMLIGYIGDESMFDTLKTGLATRLATQNLVNGMSGYVKAEKPITEADLKWFALKDFVKNGALVVAGAEAAKETWNSLIEGNRTGLLKVLQTFVWKAPQNLLIQKIVKETSPAHLNAMDVGVRVLKGDSLQTILGDRAKLVPLQIISTIADAWRNPKGFGDGLRYYINHQKALFSHALFGEKFARLTALVGIPIAGTVTAVALAMTSAAGVALAAAAFVGTFFIVAPIVYSFVNAWNYDTEKTVRDYETQSYIDSKTNEQVVERRNEKMRELKIPEQPPEEPKGIVNLAERRDRLVKTVLARLEEEYTADKAIVGDLQVREVVIPFVRETEATDLFHEEDSDDLKAYLKAYLSYKVGEEWLKDKLLAACTYELAVAVTWHETAEKYESWMRQRDYNY